MFSSIKQTLLTEYWEKKNKTKKRKTEAEGERGIRIQERQMEKVIIEMNKSR